MLENILIVTVFKNVMLIVSSIWQFRQAGTIGQDYVETLGKK